MSVANRCQFVYHLLELLERPGRQDWDGGKGLLTDAGVCRAIMWETASCSSVPGRSGPEVSLCPGLVNFQLNVVYP